MGCEFWLLQSRNDVDLVGKSLTSRLLIKLSTWYTLCETWFNELWMINGRRIHFSLKVKKSAFNAWNVKWLLLALSTHAHAQTDFCQLISFWRFSFHRDFTWKLIKAIVRTEWIRTDHTNTHRHSIQKAFQQEANIVSCSENAWLPLVWNFIHLSSSNGVKGAIFVFFLAFRSSWQPKQQGHGHRIIC